MTAGNRVVVTLPAYQAETTLEKTVADLPPGVADELILVDDASADNTVELARGLGISVYVHPHNRGYGGNQKTCYTKALEHGAEIVVMLHPDYQYEPRSVPLLIAPILAGDADMTFGSRFAGLGNPREGGMPTYRYVGNRITTVIQNLILGSRFSEMHSGMRAYTRECLLSLPFLGYSEDFIFDAQLLVDAVTSGQRVVEVPIPTRYTKESSSIGIARSLRYITAGIAYAARRAAVRGRRGRRYPLTSGHPGKAARSRVGSRTSKAKAKTSDTHRAEIAKTLSAYVVPGTRLVQLDASGATIATPIGGAWEPHPWREEPASADVAVIWSEGGVVGSGVMSTASEAVVPEGLVALAIVGTTIPAPADVHRDLEGAGLRMIEWLQSTRTKSPLILVVARVVG